jgi:hypothetical protein
MGRSGVVKIAVSVRVAERQNVEIKSLDYVFEHRYGYNSSIKPDFCPNKSRHKYLG